jgi:hypothetical protein
MANTQGMYKGSQLFREFPESAASAQFKIQHLRESMANNKMTPLPGINNKHKVRLSMDFDNARN